MTIDPVPNAVVTFMSVVGKVLSFCESVYVQLRPMSVARYASLLVLSILNAIPVGSRLEHSHGSATQLKREEDNL
jgi:hypothetical protein